MSLSILKQALDQAVDNRAVDQTKVLALLTRVIEDLQAQVTKLSVALEQDSEADQALADALNGDLHFVLDSADETVDVGDLNAAESGTFSTTFSCRLATIGSDLDHTWFRAEAQPNVGGTFDDVDITPPLVSGSAIFNEGVLSVTLVWDTGAGKTYLAGDTVTIAIAAPEGTFLALLEDADTPVALVENVTKTYTVE